MTARNASCPCGSGKKFKRCHGRTPAVPADTAIQLRRARVALGEGKFDQAIALLSALPATSKRDHTLTHALIRRRRGKDLEQARKVLFAWAERANHDIQPWFSLAEIGFYSGDMQLARRACEALDSRAPDQAETLLYRGISEQLSGQLESGVQLYSQALAARGFSREEDDALSADWLRTAATMQACEVASGQFPGSRGKAPEGLFEQQQERSLLETELETWTQDRAGRLNATQRESLSDGWYNLGVARLAGFTSDDRRIQNFDAAIELNANHLLARTNRALSYNYSVTANVAEVFAAHQETGAWLEQFVAGKMPVPQSWGPSGQRIRIGYLSSDFRQHSVAHFILPVLAHHDSGRFEVFVYHNHLKEDEYTARARTLARHFRNVNALDDESLCAAIRQDRIDILVDLNGLTGGHRLAVLAMRAAPVQVSWIGYPNTTGLPAVDYRVVDAATDPIGQADELATEALLRMSQVFSVYEAPGNLPTAEARASKQSGPVTFGAFNALPKLNDTTLAGWAAILKQLPGSRILVKNPALEFEPPRREILQKLTRLGVEPATVEFAGADRTHRQHMEQFNRIDIHLDSFPYNGTTTTCDSLVMGVPVISQAGFEHRSRVGLSQLQAVGLDSLVCNDHNTFVDTAIKLAENPELLHAAREDLRRRMLDSSLMDARQFTREFEDQLANALEHHGNRIHQKTTDKENK